MANPTASTIIGLARNVLRAEAQSDVPVLGTSFMLSLLSDANYKWARAFNISGPDPVLFQREFGVDLAAETAIDDADGITTSDTTITADSTTGYDSAGVAIVWDDNMPDFFSYTATTATTFTGVTGLGFAHEDNDAIQPLYALPSTFGTFRKAPNYGDGVRLNGTPLYAMGGPPDPGFFSAYDDGTTKYLWLPKGSTGTASVLYDKISSTIDSIDDTVDVPEEFKMFLVWHLVAHAYIGREENAGLYQFALEKSERILQEALQVRNVGKKIRTRPFSRRDYTVVNGRLLYH